MNTQVPVKSLSPTVQLALSRAGYRKLDVNVASDETHCVYSMGSQGDRAFAALVKGDSITAFGVGSFGGPNMFSSQGKIGELGFNPDNDRQYHEVPIDGAIITGIIGKFATVWMHPIAFARLVARDDATAAVVADALLDGAPTVAATVLNLESLTLEEKQVLYGYGALKSGEYRQRQLEGLGKVVDALVTRGLLKRASNGATQITTTGKAMRDQWNNSRNERCMLIRLTPNAPVASMVDMENMATTDNATKWHKRNRLGNGEYTCEMPTAFDDKPRTTRFVVSKCRAPNRAKTKMIWMWSWSGYARPVTAGGTTIEIEPKASYSTMREACASAEWAASRGFHWAAGEWMPNGATRDFPDGVSGMER
jgi:hypothetical protein